VLVDWFWGISSMEEMSKDWSLWVDGVFDWALVAVIGCRWNLRCFFGIGVDWVLDFLEFLILVVESSSGISSVLSSWWSLFFDSDILYFVFLGC